MVDSLEQMKILSGVRYGGGHVEMLWLMILY